MHNQDSWKIIQDRSEKLSNIKNIEQFITPDPTPGWLEFQNDLNQEERTHYENFRALVLKWHKAALLPIDQLILNDRK